MDALNLALSHGGAGEAYYFTLTIAPLQAQRPAGELLECLYPLKRGNLLSFFFAHGEACEGTPEMQ